MKKNFLWFDDRFYILTQDELLQAKKEGQKINLTLLELLKNDNKEFYLPSSTTILGAAPKPWLSSWRGQIGNVEADRIIGEALKKGTNVHDAIYIWLNDGIVIYNSPKKPSFTDDEITKITEGKPFIVLKDQQEHLEVYRLIRWFEEVKPVILASEFTVISLEHGYAGTGDLLVSIEEGNYNIAGSKLLNLERGIYVIDYKTGNSFDVPNYYRQVSSYAAAIEENRQYEIKGSLIIHTNDNKIKSGIEGLKTYKITRDELKKSFSEFLKIKAVYDLDLDYQPKVIELPTILSKRKVEAA